MKKISALILCAALILNCITLFAAENDGGVYFFDTFEQYSEGALKSCVNWKVYDKSAGGGFAEFVSGGIENKCVMLGTTAADPFVVTAGLKMNTAFFISFDMKINSYKNGIFIFSLRNSNDGTSHGFLRGDNTGKIKLLPDNGDGMAELRCGDGIENKYRVSMLLDVQNGVCTMYLNGKQAAKTENFMSNSKISDFNNIGLSFYTWNCSADNSLYSVYIDNVSAVPLKGNGIKSGMPCIVYGGGEAKRFCHYGDGELYMPVVNDTENSVNLTAVTACFDSGGRLSKVYTNPLTMPQGSETTLKIPEVCADSVKCMFFENVQNIKPVSPPQYINKVCYLDITEKAADLELLQMFNENSAGIHPRISAASADFERVKSSTDLTAWKQEVVSYADVILERPDSDISYTINGGRLLSVSRRLKKYVSYLAMAYRITENREYADKAWAFMQRAAEFADWNPSHILDTSEMTTGMAIGYDWLYGVLTPQKRIIAETAIKEKGLDIALTGTKIKSIGLTRTATAT